MEKEYFNFLLNAIERAEFLSSIPNTILVQDQIVYPVIVVYEEQNQYVIDQLNYSYTEPSPVPSSVPLEHTHVYWRGTLWVLQ